MALWHFTNFNKYGNPRHRIFYRPDGEPFSHGPGFGPTMVRRFKYDYEHPVMPPTILKLNGKTYLMPVWKEVVEGTTAEDINWIKPKPKKTRTSPVIKTFTSGSSDKVYETKYYPDSGKFYCTCPGAWRSFGNCKHIKQLKSEL